MIMCNLKYIFFLIAFWPVIIMQGQETYSCDAMLDSLIEPKLTGDLFQPPNPGSLEGSQFFIEDWLNGDVYLTNKNIVRNKVLKYNGFLDRLICLTPVNYQQVNLDKDQIEGFCLNDKSGVTYCFKKIPIKDDLSPDSLSVFAEVLSQSRISLFAYRKVINKGYEVTSNGHYSDIYKAQPLYLFGFENGKTIGFKRCNKHDVMMLFPDKKEVIMAKLKELKLPHFLTEADLIQVTKVLNEIL
jgi:hypothetical protein